MMGRMGLYESRYNETILLVTVQGTSAEDLIHLRDRILTELEENGNWSVSNDLNSKPKIEKPRRRAFISALSKILNID